jgi:hypothetical protein
MKEATEKVVAEEPKKGKTKQGDKPETAVDGAQKKERTPRTPANVQYRILAGVDAAKFRGQRQIVVKALQSLGDGSFTAEQIAAKCEGLVSKTPVIASATYHLKGLVADKEVEQIVPAAPAAAETEDKAA